MTLTTGARKCVKSLNLRCWPAPTVCRSPTLTLTSQLRHFAHPFPDINGGQKLRNVFQIATLFDYKVLCFRNDNSTRHMIYFVSQPT